ncbi:MAG: dolichyl-phosphate beta-D-mannosyltransferase [Spirochaetes bacterium GWD1_27_9]|nr:MAG: dolichyl-phosphate beta-D-mannosyltransferase [Spirochaetes bacterium GWB1_27_13]OHD25975.1 MAG: dolichyl-phosphate beta-D-mannosyltransferase [Spirochaetes bacterium GWC1_27_15]OHD31653.1 MAG: dolichyl-phosphate beta-D-mannosyltransferase [Spirochaetes bacterium GWD1_27_9]
MKTLIIIPTYNEKENISDILPQIFSETKEIDVNILIVDDGSPDGTANIVKDMIQKNYKDKLFILERSGKQGLATAYITGFKWGIERNYDVFIEMDADFSHNPKYLKEMIGLMQKYDFIVASRYVKNGGVVGWGPIRKIISYGGSFYSRMVLGIKIRDLTGGFNLWSKDLLLKLGLDNIISRGYLFQIELKYRATKMGFKGIEFPIIFPDRERGKSKMSKKIFLEALINIWKIRKIKF